MSVELMPSYMRIGPSGRIPIAFSETKLFCSYLAGSTENTIKEENSEAALTTKLMLFNLKSDCTNLDGLNL